jgi:hypothetical protein
MIVVCICFILQISAIVLGKNDFGDEMLISKIPKSFSLRGHAYHVMATKTFTDFLVCVDEDKLDVQTFETTVSSEKIVSKITYDSIISVPADALIRVTVSRDFLFNNPITVVEEEDVLDVAIAPGPGSVSREGDAMGIPPGEYDMRIELYDDSEATKLVSCVQQTIAIN